jgi:hypothetical protein
MQSNAMMVQIPSRPVTHNTHPSLEIMMGNIGQR